MLPPASRCSPVTGPMFSSVAAAPVQAGLVTNNVASTLSAPAASSESQYPGPQCDTDVDMTLKNDNDDDKDNIEDTGKNIKSILSLTFIANLTISKYR